MKKKKSLLLFTFFSFLLFFTPFSCEEAEEINASAYPYEELVYPSGEACGIKILSDGILVISVTDIDEAPSPAKKAGIIPGDFVKGINGNPLKDSDDFIKKVKELKDKEFEIEFEREGQRKSAKLKPYLKEGEFVLGMWVRDSIAGLGTLTFYSGDKKSFSALGHSISDTDTGEVMPVKDGELVYANISSIRKGEKGSPGGLVGYFTEESKVIGNITDNTLFGLSGKISNPQIIQKTTPVPLGRKDDIRLGKAKIITTIEKEPELFNIEIIKINKQNKPDVKGLVIKVTDKRLLEKTGGIVQGMSGSPIIQDGKLVGAVTHVFVNDPTRGYGIFIENMLAETEKIK
ncbi:MAG: SpoIVB peptidase [Ruminococcaceae bacterium]|nr:SpoIVB peptidase [Oscillospiraceae bacterium]